ncbi:PPK2 family polyphosphate kinase [Sphingobacterium bovistauri]|uniref:Polyphosphate kinase 2 family protein n=1 Tax=Sphingobacterium bovistauri TaxID=2781959 RepID=A0ABS7Z990_9SPHI|nr:PPK2 family polyphosphate kinase [Sphingobacterium bovistauri]MCA5006763.1 polyphosphate kinase 2 family protein [Sphingobacterium bovistauri]
MKRFKATKDFKIKNYPTKINMNAEKAKSGLKDLRKQIAQIQDIMYAHNKYSVLICLQGMDTAGKDSLIREVFKDFNARGVVVHSFKTPTSKELQHDYLWRHYIALPERGKFAVFNRTHYENVLVTRVHPEYLLNENLPKLNDIKSLKPLFWKNRFDQINAFEKHITQNGTIILKFYLNLSKQEQKDRLLRRLEEEDHNWKFSPGDLAERKLWDKYMHCYEEAIKNTSTAYAPWFIIPADDKKTARFIVAKTILEELKKYKDISYPELPEDIEQHINSYRNELNDEE